MTDLPVLYSFRRCPYAMRARMALLVAGQDCILREVLLRNKPDEMIAASSKATVPVLVLPDGGVIDESLDIMRWVLEIRDPEDWLETDGDAAEELVAANDGPFKHHLDRYKYATRHDTDPVEHRDAGAAILADLDQRLEKRSNLQRDQRSFADIALFPFVRQFAGTDRAWFDAQPWPNLRAWLDRHLESALFKTAMLRLQPWQPGDAERRLLHDRDEIVG
ncbi:glutathione S-transferase [Parasphingopyxis algicola]|uniref:glutathione S-transferase n=1 Tax=Parasphingopyxis algicola TaxID=2026624 RepID=UPI001FEB0190|nr:glutathione S-transferase [Parasphingopyxis algicola]QLC25441.1 glutathione S-transferase [Parasphingopyxis algicola]